MMYFAIAVCGGIGALMRFLVSTGVSAASSSPLFPYGTLFVNVLGSFLIGFLTWMLLHKFQASEMLRNAVLVGFLGGFTTFSSFSMEIVSMLEQQSWMKAMAYALSSVLCCVVMCFIGIALAKQLT